MKRVPTITWNPCNPVLAKKALPKTLSAKVNPASLYSKYCKPVKSIANIIVIIVPYIEAFLLPWIKPWWAQVINA